ncbi:MAG: DUF4124 domain-containing protein [Comamonas sp.]|nr:DUF4124 domain-containing protein [Comamonas sp.]
MPSLKWSLVVVAAIATSPAMAVYKCKDANGKLSYQSHPCAATGTEGERISAAPAITTGSESNGDGQARLEAIKSYNRRFNAAANQQVMRGMTKDQVTMAWGNPTDINRTIGSYGVHEQWVYRRGHGSAQYVYFENGVVTSIQD